jgi:hypothetical protein
MMNQTQKRLQIIKLAISITDIETIQLQVAKLRLLEGDKKIEEIITKLDAKNYAQAQSLITDYIDTPIQTIHQRSTPKQNYTETEQELIEKFDLFVKERDKEDNEEYIDNIETFARTSTSTAGANYETLFHLNEEDILHDNISLDITRTQNEDDFFATKEEPKALETEDIPKDTFFDNFKKEEASPGIQQNKEVATDESEVEPQETEITEEEDEVEALEPAENEVTEKDEIAEESSEEMLEDTQEESTETVEAHSTQTITYKPLSTIKQKFQELSQNYPPRYVSEHPYPSVHACLMSISYHSYTNEKIYKILENALKLAHSSVPGEKAEATELILLSGVTEDRFAKLIFARELYRGELFEQNIPNAFDLISELADEGYPEALCDLGQFYEHGIGTKKDKKRAKQFYKKSMDHGVQRAQKHYNRLTSRLFSFSS